MTRRILGPFNRVEGDLEVRIDTRRLATENPPESAGSHRTDTGDVNAGDVNAGDVDTGVINTGSVNTGDTDRGDKNTNSADTSAVGLSHPNSTSRRPVSAVVEKAQVNSPLFRGFEQILLHKPPLDALVYTPRICGICSVAQSYAAATALATCMNLTPCRNGNLIANLVLACENVADHLSHFYLFFMPDFARPVYAGQHWHAAVSDRFTAQRGEVYKHVLSARAQWLQLTGILAGKWPHTLALQPGGSSRAVKANEKVRLLALIGAFRQFLQQTLFGDQLERVAELYSAQALQQWAETHQQSDLGIFLQLSQALQLDQLGSLNATLMSYGAYANAESSTATTTAITNNDINKDSNTPSDHVHSTNNNDHAFARGLRNAQGQYQSLDDALISEDQSYSRSSGETSHPYHGSTQAGSVSEDDKAYSWCKAPRLDRQIVEVGAVARQVINGHPLICELTANGTNVHNRVVARLLEIALLIPLMENWVREIQPGDSFCTHAAMPEQAQGVGLIEAARGSLGHWLQIDQGRIENYQIIAPTTWNFSPRDESGTPGPLEQALVGTTIGEPDGEDAIRVDHVVRSFDPCMVCTVH